MSDNEDTTNNEESTTPDEDDDVDQVQQQSSAANNRRKVEKPAAISAYVVMSDIVDKLKLINYEDIFPPISRSYFVMPLKINPGEQFRTLVEYITWILQDLLKLQGYEAPDQYSDPVATASYLVTELKKVGVVVESSAKLKQAHGEAVCLALDALLDLAIEKLGIKLKPPTIPQSMIFSEDEDIDEDEDVDDEVNEEEGMDDEDEDEMYMDQHAPNGSSRNERQDHERRNQVIESDVNAQEWKLELEHVAPQLVLRLHVDHKDWRTHVESISEQEKTITDLMPDTTEKLNKISDEISKVTDRISKREKMLSEDNSVSSLLLSYKKSQEELETITSQYKEYEESISALSNELSTVSTELEDVKNESDLLRKKMGDTTPLNMIKESAAKLKQEIRVMDLRVGVLTDGLLQAKVKSTRAMSASASRARKSASGGGGGIGGGSSSAISGSNIQEFGFDPFAVGHNSSSYLSSDGYSQLD